MRKLKNLILTIILVVAQLEFWGCLSKTIDERKLSFKGRKAMPQHWYDIPVGSSKCHISVCALSQEKKLRFDLWISNDKKLYDDLEQQKEEIENNVGWTLAWDRKEGAKASTISYELCDDFDIYDEEKYPEYSNLIVDNLVEHFYKISSTIAKLK